MAALNLLCPLGGQYFDCTSGSWFVGCCNNSNACSATGCANQDVRPTALNSTLRLRQSTQDCPLGYLWYTCVDTHPPFAGCCGNDPCNGGCSDEAPVLNGGTAGETSPALIPASPSDGSSFAIATSTLGVGPNGDASTTMYAALTLVPTITQRQGSSSSTMLSRLSTVPSSMETAVSAPVTGSASASRTSASSSAISTSIATSPSISGGAIAGIVVGAILGAFAVFGVVTFFVVRWWRKQKAENEARILTPPAYCESAPSQTNAASSGAGQNVKPGLDTDAVSSGRMMLFDQIVQPC